LSEYLPGMTSARSGTLRTPREIRPLVAALRDRFKPESIWLFGSRARGDNRADSDWDLLLEIPATIVAARSHELSQGFEAPNTLAYEIARDGKRLVD
jgi:predicted nucleotidyltransferase